MAIQFDRTTQEATFYSPLEDFDEVATEVEVRADPLTGRQARIVPDNFLRPEGEPDIDEVVSDDGGCFFCPGTVTESTPKYPDWVGVDRGSVGEATSFPNLNPYGAHSNVVALTEDHYVPIDGFTPETFANGLEAAMEYVTAVFDHDRDARFASINMNYLRPAGSSIVHPHVQTLVDDRGTNEQAARVEPAAAYHDGIGETYWHDLVAEERDGDRWIGSTGSVDWIAPFAPKHHFHVLGVADETGIPAADGDVVADFATGIANTLSYYADEGLNSFNFALHLLREEPKAQPTFHPVVDIVARSVFDRHYWGDATFFTVLHDEGVVDVAPEEYGPDVAAHF